MWPPYPVSVQPPGPALTEVISHGSRSAVSARGLNARLTWVWDRFSSEMERPYGSSGRSRLPREPGGMDWREWEAMGIVYWTKEAVSGCV